MRVVIAGAGNVGRSIAAELLHNAHCRVRFWNCPGSMNHLVRNSDGDELLFITIHQVYELWFKQLLYELESARDAMAAIVVAAYPSRRNSSVAAPTMRASTSPQRSRTGRSASYAAGTMRRQSASITARWSSVGPPLPTL